MILSDCSSSGIMKSCVDHHVVQRMHWLTWWRLLDWKTVRIVTKQKSRIRSGHQTSNCQRHPDYWSGNTYHILQDVRMNLIVTHLLTSGLDAGSGIVLTFDQMTE